VGFSERSKNALPNTFMAWTPTPRAIATRQFQSWNTVTGAQLAA
jgi:hypothetical protein